MSLAGVTNIGKNAFHMCELLESVNLPEVTTIGEHAFASCGSLQSVSLPNVQTIGNYAFAGCSSLESVTLPEVETVGDYAFTDCGSLESVTLPEVETVGNDAFNSCGSLESVSLPNVQTIDRSAFGGCGSLQSVTIWRKTSAPSLEDTTVFESVPRSCTLDIPNGSSSRYTDSAGWPTTKVELWSVTGKVYDAAGSATSDATVSVYGITSKPDDKNIYTVYVRPNEDTAITASITGAGTKSITVSNVTGALTNKDICFGENATSVWIAGEELTRDNPYYHNGMSGVPGEANNTEANYNAYFDAAAGTLTLKGLNVTDSTTEKEMLLGNTQAAPRLCGLRQGRSDDLCRR